MDIRELIESRKIRSHLALVFDWLHNSLVESLDENGDFVRMVPSQGSIKMVKDYFYKLLKSQAHENSNCRGQSLVTEVRNQSVLVIMEDMTATDMPMIGGQSVKKFVQCSLDVYRHYTSTDPTVVYMVVCVNDVFRLRNVLVGIVEGCYLDLPPNAPRPKEHYLDYTESVLKMVLELIYKN